MWGRRACAIRNPPTPISASRITTPAPTRLRRTVSRTARLTNDVHRVLRKLAQVRLHRNPEGLDGDRLEVGPTVPGQRRGRLGIAHGVERRIVVAEVEGEDRDHVRGVPAVPPGHGSGHRLHHHRDAVAALAPNSPLFGFSLDALATVSMSGTSVIHAERRTWVAPAPQ